ncbi:RagB/SusD family nutrient uptake outer membrane protein [Dyadobacter psychrotolerans]|uniref:RagB/SusD family nutrient uptake outer membrane protein n=1 Tax=Dyadobacter psychrotolerans TaxID=2541721 RepID=A0A4R5DQP5_9BACT|nr:RagB/SusD family nutrient uptake outer membrane protein [Dyadobacter psychrotolerans]TDE14510.1 RagB/SusD family nutrient uptake outer membrane protein [Dyadobacter psychrotolerans]
MKKILTAILLITSVSACNVLDIKPLSQISSSQAFASLNSAEGVVNGMYNNLQTVYMWRVQVISDVASDMSQQIDTWDALISADEFNFSADNSEVEDLYTSLYRCVDIANSIVANVPEMTVAQTNKDDLMGQAYFVRALSYFDLARFFGGIPNVYGTEGVVLKLTPSVGVTEADFSPRSTLRQTYDQVEKDLIEAIAKLPETRASTDLTRAKATKPAARALLARYYLYNQQWAKAEQFATEAIANLPLSVAFETAFRSKNTAESLFELQFNATDGAGLRNWYYPSSLSGRGGTALHDKTYAEMIADPADLRGKLTAKNPTTNTFYTTKWNTAQNADNIQILRRSEQYLIRAEARAEQNNLTGAAADINVVRTRAGVAATTAATKDALIAAVMQERKLEFVGEGHRWFDVIRRGTGLTTFASVVRTRGSLPSYSIKVAGKQVLPIPSAEIRTNTKVVQNEAYR